MSQVTLQGNPSGAGVFTVAAPSSNTNRTLTLPDASGTLATDADVSSAVPAGVVIYVAQNTAPIGYLKANGAAVSRTTYAALFAAIGTTYGAGDGSTTFNLPDLRGEFIRGWDDGRGVDTGRAFGSAQAQAIQSHTHNFGASFNGSGINSNGGYVRANSGNEANTRATGGAETRPRNIALLACIKF